MFHHDLTHALTPWPGVLDDVTLDRHDKSKHAQARAARMSGFLRGRTVCYGKGGGNAPAPDPLIGEAARMNAAVAKEALAWYKEQYAAGADDRAQAARIAQDAARQQQSIARENHAISKDYWDYQKNTFRPLEGRIVNDANSYDTAARRDQEAGQAIQGVRSGFDAQRAQMLNNAAAMGINPNSGNFAAQQRQMGIAEAIAAAGAGNQARNNVELQGYARRMDAANLGRNLPTNQATSAGVALNAGNSAVASGQVPSQIQQQAAHTMQQGFNTAQQGYANAGNIAHAGYGAQLRAYELNANRDSGVMGALGNIAGAVLPAIISKWR